MNTADALRALNDRYRIYRDTLDRIVDSIEAESVRAQNKVVEEGEPASRLYVIYAGAVDLFTTQSDGTARLQDSLKDGDEHAFVGREEGGDDLTLGLQRYAPDLAERRRVVEDGDAHLARQARRTADLHYAQGAR